MHLHLKNIQTKNQKKQKEEEIKETGSQPHGPIDLTASDDLLPPEVNIGASTSRIGEAETVGAPHKDVISDSSTVFTASDAASNQRTAKRKKDSPLTEGDERKKKSSKRRRTRTKRKISTSDDSEDPKDTYASSEELENVEKTTGKTAKSSQAQTKVIVIKDEEWDSMDVTRLGSVGCENINRAERLKNVSKNIQGPIRGQMRDSLANAGKAIQALVKRARTQGDTKYLEMRNVELAAQVASLKRNEEIRKQEVAALEREVRELKMELKGLKNQMSRQIMQASETGTDAATEATTWRQHLRRKQVRIASVDSMSSRAGGNDDYEREEATSVTTDPEEEMDERRSQLNDINKEIKKLVGQRNQLKTVSGKSKDPKGKNRRANNTAGRDKPRIISDVQVAPPRSEQRHEDGDWKPVERSHRRKTPGTDKTRGRDTKEDTNNDRKGRRRPPRTAAVSITGKGEGFSYAEALKKARSGIALATMGIERSRIRKSANGGVLIEIPGPEGSSKADALADKLKEVLEDVIIGRPTIKGEMLLIGLDDSVTPEEVMDVIAEMGSCRKDEVKVGQIRPMRNGLGTIWVQCPLAVAAPLSSSGKIRIGWSSVRVVLLEKRPIQCYRCWHFGHMRAKCDGKIDRTGACFKCGQNGHPARQCGNEANCPVCKDDGCESNNSWNALDLLKQHAREESVDVSIVSEPPANVNKGDCVTSANGMAAIHCYSGISFNLITRDNNFILVKTGNLLIASVYISPNIDFNYFNDVLYKIQNAIGNYRTPLIIGGDFNAHSVLWGATRTNRRGRALADWAAELNLCLSNKGKEPTCVRHTGSSIVDLTWSTPDIAGKILNWKVLKEVETLSDHMYITYEVASRDNNPPRETKSRVRWNCDKLDQEFFEKSLEWSCSIGPTGEDLESDDGPALWLRRVMTEACEAAAPRIPKRIKKRYVHWWSSEIEELRTECIRARRNWTRAKRRRDEPNERELAVTYRNTRNRLRQEINKAKNQAWANLVNEVEKDPWGLPYKLVLNKLRRADTSLAEKMDHGEMDALMDTLFPRARAPRKLDWHALGYRWEEDMAVTPLEVLNAIKSRKRTNTAPGPDGISIKFWKKAPACLIAKMAECFTACLKNGAFPKPWKRANLVLIPKGEPEVGRQIKARPICLLDDASKLFEKIIADRIQEFIRDKGYANYSENQFGFRKARSTTDAILAVKETIQAANRRGKKVMAVSLDIKNAFNSVLWKAIKDMLKRKKIPKYIRRIIRAYLSDRSITYTDNQGSTAQRAVEAGVPQGSILGPILWNLTYDLILKQRLPPEYKTFGFADDTMVVAEGDDPHELCFGAEDAVRLIKERLDTMGLSLAAEKTEIITFPKTRTNNVNIGGSMVRVGDGLKYLGVMIDTTWYFKTHLNYAADKALRVSRALHRIMPNLRGPSEPKRKLYYNVILSILLYASPVWGDSYLKNKNLQPILRRAQRSIALRVVAAYRTVSLDAATLLARVPPMDILIRERDRYYKAIRDMRAAGTWSVAAVNDFRVANAIQTRTEWEAHLEQFNVAGARTRTAILPSLDRWMSRTHG
ncbi:PREDICTED: uncharacterized protein LOC105557606 [Vollenhovia emeryi]|uniref:uncharacterized protein LOC105557606 n=1 Tax=Vollenhovia emeryi TaxID=411798 RepID=UPI0005F4E1A6|nr:PREDICTED: uncharacterized protein LOC105557606 [Vollenhovia emeryi]